MPCKNKGFLLKAAEKSDIWKSQSQSNLNSQSILNLPEICHRSEPAQFNMQSQRPSTSSAIDPLNSHKNEIGSGKNLNFSLNGTNNASDVDILIKEKETLQEQLYMAKGQLKIVEENFKTNLNQRNEEIKSLKADLFASKSEYEKTIKVLKSKLEFKEASLHGAQQEFMNLKYANESLNESIQGGNFPKFTTVVSPNSNRGRKRINEADVIKSQVPKKQKSLFKDLVNSFFSKTDAGITHYPVTHPVTVSVMKNESASTSKDIITKLTLVPPIMKPDSSTNIIHLNENTTDIEQISKKVNKLEHVPQIMKQNSSTNIVRPNTAKTKPTDLVQLIEPFNFTLNISDENNYLDLLSVSGIKCPQECCVSINQKKMFYWSMKAMEKFLPVLQLCMNFHDDPLTPPVLNVIKEIINLLTLQFQRLFISLKRRRGSIDSTLEEILSRKVFNKSDVLLNPQYSCLFHYIYPISEVIKKLSLIASYRLDLIVNILIDCILPNFFDIVNYLHIGFCCTEQIDEESVHRCRTFTSDFENDFIKEIIEFSIRIISQSSDSIRSCIFDKFILYIKKILPLFASKMNLKVVLIELFCTALTYSEFVKMISNHSNNNCIIFIIMDFLNCKCIAECGQNELIWLTNHISQVILSLCSVGFTWKPDCPCTSQIFSLTSNLCLNVSRHVSESEWSGANKKCVQSILFALIQMKKSCGPETFYQFKQLKTSNEFFLRCEYVVDHQLPLLLEDLWPAEYQWFAQLMGDLSLLK